MQASLVCFFFFTSFLLYILSKSKSSFFGFYYSWNRNNCCWDSFSCLLTDDGNFVVRQLWTPFNIWLHKFSSLRCLRKSAYCALLIISYLDIREKRPKMAKKKIFSIRQQILQQLNLDPNKIETRILHFPITEAIVSVIKWSQSYHKATATSQHWTKFLELFQVRLKPFDSARTNHHI